MPHVSFLPRKPEPVGAEFKCIADGVSRVMLALEIQEGKDAMKLKQHHDDLGATAACNVRLCSTAGFSGSGRVLCGDSWFASATSAVALKKKLGMFFVGNVKTAHRKFPKTVLQSECKDVTRGDSVVKEAVIDGVKVFGVGWKCGKHSTVMTIVSTCGTNLPGSDSTCAQQDRWGNNTSVTFPRPDVVELYQTAAPAVDLHNRIRQGTIALEKRWVTQRWDLRIVTTIFGIVLTDSYLAMQSSVPSTFKDMGVLDFVDVFTKELLDRGISMCISSNLPATDIVVRAPCSHASFGRVLKTRKSSGVDFEAQIQKRCGLCGKLTSHFCVACRIAVCDEVRTGRDCYNSHVQNPTMGLTKRKKN